MNTIQTESNQNKLYVLIKSNKIKASRIKIVANAVQNYEVGHLC